MRPYARTLGGAALIALLALDGCGDDAAQGESTSGAPASRLTAAPAPGPAADAASAGPSVEEVAALAAEVFGPLPAYAAVENQPHRPESVALGRMLFHDARLSGDGTRSCAGCHDLGTYGVSRSVPRVGASAGRNVPTVLNAALQAMQYWDGRAADVEEQARMALLDPNEMGMASEGVVVLALRSIPGYAPLFAAAFPGEEEPLTFVNVAKAIGAFERELVSPASFDRFLKGRRDALSDEQIEGLDLFLNAGCTACHQGPTIGGLVIQKLGLIKPYPTEDPGRAGVTKNEEERSFFKVPQLRNVSETGPYLHDGSLDSLEATVRMMSEYQLARELNDHEADVLVEFLASLTGRVDPELVRPPELPK